MTDTTPVRVQTVEIDRGKDTLVTQVPEHEVEVLRVVHGPANIRVIEDDTDMLDMDASGEGEILRLQNVYKRVNAPDPVRIAFPGGARDLPGFNRSAAKEVVMSHVVDHKKAAKKAAAKTAK